MSYNMLIVSSVFPYRFEIGQTVRYLEQCHFSLELFTMVGLLNPDGRQVLIRKKTFQSINNVIFFCNKIRNTSGVILVMVCMS